jgi:hypothetical protein
MCAKWPGRSVPTAALAGRSSRPAPGFYGSCFQNNILNLVVLCRHDGLHEVAATWEQVVELNTWQQQCIGVLGFADGLRPAASTRPTPTTPASRPPSASAAT